MTLYKFSVGVVLAVAMVGVLGMSALVFSSRDFQYGLQLISPSTNGLISFAQLDAADRQIQQLESESAGPRGELLEIDQQIATGRQIERSIADFDVATCASDCSSEARADFTAVTNVSGSIWASTWFLVTGEL